MDSWVFCGINGVSRFISIDCFFVATLCMNQQQSAEISKILTSCNRCLSLQILVARLQ